MHAYLSDKKLIPSPAIMCLLAAGAILVAALWPFNFIPTNKVSWLPGGFGIGFHGQGIVHGRNALFRQEPPSRSSGLTIEMLIRPATETRDSVDSILTFYTPDKEHFLFSQRKTNFGIRVPLEGSKSKDPYRYLGIANIFEDRDRTYFITVSSGNGRTDIYADGKLKQSVRGISPLADRERPLGQLVLGNSPNGIHPWHGAIFGLAVYDRVLTVSEVLSHYDAWNSKQIDVAADRSSLIALYLFNEHRGELIRDYSGAENHLVMPEIFKPLELRILHVPKAERFLKSDTYLDIALNLFGFMPFGFIVCVWLRETKDLSPLPGYIVAALLGFSLSLSIELAQILLPTRVSSSLDLLTNTLGTVMGIALYRYAAPFLHKNMRGR